jgi:exopolyphosphatase/guanosine-5'-triphosphate,3'-diphosphate pyrophosphatase
MADLPIEERIHQFNIREDRANVIVPAMHIYLSVMKWSNCSDILVPQMGLADAIIKKLYSEKTSQS